MEIKRDQLNKWKTIYARGDYMRIAEDYVAINQRISQKIARDRIRTAMRTGICTDNLYPVIVKYYEKIEKQLAKK